MRWFILRIAMISARAMLDFMLDFMRNLNRSPGASSWKRLSAILFTYEAASAGATFNL
jgi:hypothetical protein